MTFRDPLIAPKKSQFQQRSAPDVTHTNIINFPNPIPFNQTEWPRVRPVGPSVSHISHGNPLIYTNPIPFHTSEFAILQFLNPAFLVPPQFPNIAILTPAVVVTPMIGQIWM